MVMGIDYASLFGCVRFCNHNTKAKITDSIVYRKGAFKKLLFLCTVIVILFQKKAKCCHEVQTDDSRVG